REDGLRPARERDVEIVADRDLEFAAVELDRHGAEGAAQDRGHAAGRGARAGRERLSHPALEDPCPYLVVGVDPDERDVGAIRKKLAVLDRWAQLRQVDALELITGV